MPSTDSSLQRLSAIQTCPVASTGKYSTRPVPNMTTNADAWIVCRRRSVAPKRMTRPGATSLAIGAADPGVAVIAALLPVAVGHAIGDDDLLHPLHALVAVHLRHDHARGRTVLALERLAVHRRGQHRVGLR